MNSNCKDLLIVYQAPWPWDYLWNRAQPLARALSKRCTVVYVDCWLEEISEKWNFFKKSPILKRLFFYMGFGKLWKLEERLYRYVHRHLDTDALNGALGDRSRFRYFVLAQQLRVLKKQHRRIWLLTSRPMARGIFNLFAWDKIIVDIEDPWLSMHWAIPGLEEPVRQLLNRSDVIFANGIKIAEEYSALTEKPIHTLPNGVENEIK